MTENTTSVAAGIALTSYWWIPSLEQASGYAGKLLPILGATWLVVQIITKSIETYRKWKESHSE